MQPTPNEHPVDNPDIIEVGLGAILRKAVDVRNKIGISTQLLITRRTPGAIMGGFWELPGGKIEPGESPGDCVIRELYEELGVQVQLTEQLASIVHTYDHATVRLHTFLGVLTEDSPPPQNLEVAAHQWVTADELPQFTFLPANESILRLIVDQAMTG